MYKRQGCGCISYLIYGLHRRIDSRVKTDGIIGTGNIKIDGSGESDRVYTESRKLARTAVRTVSSDDDQTVNTVFLTNLSALFLAFNRSEFGTSCRVKNRAAASDEMCIRDRSILSDFHTNSDRLNCYA